MEIDPNEKIKPNNGNRSEQKMEISPNRWKSNRRNGNRKIDPKRWKSIRTIGNRSDPTEIDQNNWKSIRTNENRTDQTEIDQNNWKSNRPNGNRSEQLEIEPNNWKSIRTKMDIDPNLIQSGSALYTPSYTINQNRLDDAFSHQCCMAIIGGTEREIDEDGLYLSAIHYLLYTTSVYLSTSSLCKSSSNSCANPPLPLV